jgi:hypothetical protein
MGCYITATFMKIHSEAWSQFRQFFQHPVEVSQLLGAEPLINTLDEASQEAHAVKLVNAAMMPSKRPSAGRPRRDPDGGAT